jgi:predicted MFS family arabinose efflux permease
MAFSVANHQDVAHSILSAYKQGFRILFMLGAAMAALSFLFAAVLMPQIEIKHERKTPNDEIHGDSREEEG